MEKKMTSREIDLISKALLLLANYDRCMRVLNEILPYAGSFGEGQETLLLEKSATLIQLIQKFNKVLTGEEFPELEDVFAQMRARLRRG